MRGLKSKYYTDFLAQSSGCFDDYSNAEYRVKKPESYALDYKFTCKEKYGERIHVVEMRKMGDMWGTGLFKSNACDFCDDVTTELADISLGDAWIEPYSSDGMGNSVVIARSALADDIVKKGIADGSLNLVPASLEQVKSSQQGSFNHRHKGLLFRIKDAESRGRLYPIKRARFLSKQSILFNEIQRLRMKTRENSLALWVNTQNVDEFNDSFTPYLNKLKRVTKFQKIVLKVNRKIKKLRGVK
ncbi:Coenzyme F420 hydrogenase/dehydrogenase, beta subunit C-terminal domain [Klebsiella michiganensis]|uniref:Coenzyme F420 hydrogenase/dehydrogenase, beta subunit C-terminal domain n=1 Tax=Klebsiella michiganensis TaxID=1134687 RepID=UPI0030D354CF